MAVSPSTSTTEKRTTAETDLRAKASVYVLSDADVATLQQRVAPSYSCKATERSFVSYVALKRNTLI